MSLKKCPDCKTEVSKQAISCPKCGRVLKKKSHWLRNIFLTIIIFASIRGFMEDSLKDIVRANWWETATVTTVYEKLDKGANVNLANEQDGNTPIMFALKKQNMDIITTLLNKGADVNINNKKGNNALISAIDTNNMEIINLILNNNVSINNQNIDGKTALFYAIENNKDISIIKLLIEKGANINARSNDGMTPLMYASKLSLGNDLVVILIKNGAKITDIDDHNYTAVDYAKNNKNLSEKLKKTMQEYFDSKQKQITVSEDEIIADCKQAKEKVIARFNELGGENITLFAKTKVIDFSSNGVFLERNCLNVNQKWIFPELKQQFKNCKQSERVFLYTSDTEYLNDEYFKDENYLYYRDGVLKYTTIMGSTNSVPAFKRSNYRIDELYYKKYLNNRNINCD